ncbi:MAG: hypothetical protein JKP97_16890 [Rhodobacteraceae bacterium]|jgi:hypothetical protein|nr:hypothetical protein [Paracoccaceae bacterium]
MRLERDAFELSELVDRWGIAGADIRYLVASNRIRLSVRIVAQPVVLHAKEWTAEGESFFVPVEEKVFSGLGDLALRDAFRLVRDGEGHVTHLFLPEEQMLTLCRDRGICFSHVDLLVRRDCAEALEREVLGVPLTTSEAFDFRLFVYDGREFAFTMPQARALEFMMAQTQAGAPDQHHSDILNAVGSASQRLSSLFSRKPWWSQLLCKTEGRRGWYHLDPDFVIWLLTRHRD